MLVCLCGFCIYKKVFSLVLEVTVKDHVLQIKKYLLDDILSDCFFLRVIFFFRYRNKLSLFGEHKYLIITYLAAVCGKECNRICK